MWSEAASAKRDSRVVAAAPDAIVEADMQVRSSMSAHKAASATIAARWGDALFRGVLEGDAAEAAGRLESADPRRRSAGTTRPKHVIDEGAGCDRLLLMRDGALLDQSTRSCCAKAPASTIWPRLPCRIAVIEAAAR